MPKVFIIYYSLYHHIATLADAVKKGLESQGIDVEVYQVPETLSDDILEKMSAPPKPDVPIITVDKLPEADGFLFGIPTRFGVMPSQLKSFLDATGQHWANGALSGKFAGTFFSTASQHGGQETTAYTAVTYFAHHGINYVPLGFANTHMFDNSEVVGGSAYGAGTVANGDGSRQPSEKELAIAVTQGENFAKILNTFHHVKQPVTEKKEGKVEKEEEKNEVKKDDKPAATAEASKANSADANGKAANGTSQSKSAPKKEDKKPKDKKCFCM
ncbi:flavo protein-like protein [Syncephalastrum racemosum]|uniref:Flavo protein-like protein n=1 Tax=Syncephalastrum racemosum TaxID=13706 RepID=A0A1X2H8F1_SYNRA|nr:flavo protein-like protein [Syncephalastrum racemosum]